MKDIDLRNKLRAAQALVIFQRLLMLDDIWTVYLSQATSVPRRDFESITLLGEEMQRLLHLCRREAKWLLGFARREPALLGSAWALALEQIPMPGQWMRAVFERMKERGFFPSRQRAGFASFVEVAARALIAHAPEDRAQIAEKLQKIRRGEFVQGDLSKIVKCALLGCVLGGALLTQNYLALVGGFVAADNTGCFKS